MAVWIIVLCCLSLSFKYSSAFLFSVMSSPELSEPIILPSLSFRIELCHAIILSEPDFKIILISAQLRALICPSIKPLQIFLASSTFSLGVKRLNQFFPIRSFSDCSRISQPFLLTSDILPSLSKAMIITPATSR